MTIELKNEGILISKSGYFQINYNQETKKYEKSEFPMTLNTIEKNLFLTVFFDEDIRVKHIIEPIANSSLLKKLLHQNNFTKLMNVLDPKKYTTWIGDTSSQPDCNHIEFIEIYKVIYFDNVSNYVYDKHFEIQGLSYDVKTKEESDDNFVDIGKKISYSISTSNINNIMNIPFKQGKAFVETSNSITPKKEYNTYISLLELINFITWELTFYGVQED